MLELLGVLPRSSRPLLCATNKSTQARNPMRANAQSWGTQVSTRAKVVHVYPFAISFEGLAAQLSLGSGTPLVGLVLLVVGKAPVGLPR